MAETRCTCGQGHATFGQCIRAKGIRIAYCGIGEGDASKQKRWDKELDLYRSAVAQGLEPSTTRTANIRRELDLSDRYGVPFDATKPKGFDSSVLYRDGI
ncbi:MAG: hypothetical protein KGL35_14280 [Bradyrhizobium sp.]|nr:hypothetical protein [Bradyrhizobium sp.]